MIFWQSFTFNPLQENTYLLWDESLNALVIDPGCYDPEERSEIVQFIIQKGLSPQYILNTHCHVDHVLGNAFFKKKYNIPLLIPAKEKEVLDSVAVFAPFFGINNYEECNEDRFLKVDEPFKWGNSTIMILEVPGHSPGHVAFYEEGQKICFSGDVLFANSIGRSDLPGGNFNTLIKSIKEVLFKLPDETEIMPGHGPSTTIESEKRTNPYL